jgi:two-component system nitrogen regulation response regulator GlnG
MAKILVIEDDPAGSRMMRALIEHEGFEAVPVINASAALETLSSIPSLELVFLDLGLPDMDGMELLEKLKASRPDLPVIVLTGDTDVSSAVKAIQKGALNYFTKPINGDQVMAAMKAALEQSRLKNEVRSLKAELGGQSLYKLMGPGPAIRRLQEEVGRVAPTQFTVLVHGKTGAGKEVVARAIHDQSERAAQSFIALDCGAIPEALLESELFGYEKGAFSGAERRREGHFQLAQGGTLFLDEIANMPLGLQAKLLRVLQERKLQPLGGAKGVDLDVRFIAASNHDLEQEAEKGRFRQDLFFRLAEFRISLPSLSERPEDISYLAQRFLEETAIELRRAVNGLGAEALEMLKAHSWPGNVRELRNVIRQAVLQSEGSLLEAKLFARLLKKGGSKKAAAEAGASHKGLSLREAGEAGLAAAEREAIRQALSATKGKILPAAKLLKTDNKTLHVKLKKYGIRARDFEPGEA